MTLTYRFDPDDYNGFEKDLTQSDIEEYLQTLPTEEVVGLVKDSFNLYTKEDQHQILADVNEPNFACPNFERWVADEWDLCVELVMEAETLYRMEDELHDYFEDAAYKEWTYEQEHKDPDDEYAQRGLSRADFY